MSISRTTPRRRLRPALLLLTTAILLAACGSSGPPEKGLLISGAGIRTTQPPWPVQDQGLAQRIRRLGLPPGGNETFHIHALLSIYNPGLYLTIPANIGIDQRHHVESSLHTHDTTGIIHMEASRPFHFTLGDVFAEWGVRFGAGTLGSLQDDGPNRVWVYVNGTLISDPARHILANNDDIAIGYGTQTSFPHHPPPLLLKRVATGGLSCSKNGKNKATSCLAPTHPTNTK